MAKHRRKEEIPTHWEIPYDAEGEDFVFTFLSDGTGKCRDVAGETETPFNWNAADVQKLHSGEAEIVLHGMASELFWSEINDQLEEDAVITDEEIFSHSEEDEVEFTCGSREELRTLTRLILHSFPPIWCDGADSRTVTFTAEGENSGEEAALESDDYFLKLGSDLAPEDRERVVELLALAIGQNTPVGEYLAYNDGAHRRRSGYSWRVKQEVVIVERPSFHEIAEARGQLRTQLKTCLSTLDLDRLLRTS